MTPAQAVASLRGIAPNFRPLGEAVVAPGRLYRSSSMTRFDAAQWAALRVLGVRTLIDLRGANEIISMPVLPDSDFELLSVPLVPEQAHIFPNAHNIDEAAARAHMITSYRRIVASQGAAIGRIFGELTKTGATPAVIFCTAGKDRTGIVAALLMQAIGATHAQTHVDYAATNDAMAGDGGDRVMALAARASHFAFPSGVARSAMLRADTRYLDAALDEAGPVFSYLARHDFGSQAVSRLTEALVDHRLCKVDE